MADEALIRGHMRAPFNPPSPGGCGGTGKRSGVPKEFAWPSLLAGDRDESETPARFQVGWTAFVQPATISCGRIER